MGEAPNAVLVTWTKGGRASVATPASAGRVAACQGYYVLRADSTPKDRLRALLRRAHDAMSRREPDGVTEAEWDGLVAEIAREVGL